MSAAQVTEAHAHAAANAIGFKTVADANYWGNCSDMQKIDKIAQLIANSEARGVEAADFALQQERNIHMTTIAERDQLRAEVERLKQSRDKQLRDCVVFKQEAERNQSLWRSEQARAEKAEAELAARRKADEESCIQFPVRMTRGAYLADVKTRDDLRAEVARLKTALQLIANNRTDRQREDAT